MPSWQDSRPSYLVRLLRGHSKAEVFRLRRPREPVAWHFPDGVAVVSDSLSDALRVALRMETSD